MKLLYVQACPRGDGISRTLRLADVFIDAVYARCPDAVVTVHTLQDMGLQALDGVTLAQREVLIDAREWNHPVFSTARTFAQADAIVVAAPYWDLMFPAMLKVYIEHVFIRELTFRYEADRPIGLCHAKRALFLTTAGSAIGPHNFGVDYLRATFAMLGIVRFDAIAAEGLDLSGADAEGILRDAMNRAVQIAGSFADA